MENIATWWNRYGPTKRRLIQLYSALLYNAYLKGFVNGSIYTGSTKALCVPGFNCYSCPGAVGACPLGSVQAAVASSGQHIGFYMIGIILLYGLIAGRTICGFLCPLGLIQELLHKIPTPKLRKSRLTRAMTYLKYVFLAVFVFAITLYYGLAKGMAVPAFCKYICPAGTVEGAMGLLSNPNNEGYFGMLGIFFTRKFIIMLIIGLACVFCYRSFCRFICPLGALYGLFSRIAIVGIKVDPLRCNGCGLCVKTCKMDVRYVGDHECIHCGECMDRCPKEAISLKAGKYTLMCPSKNNGNDSPNDSGISEGSLAARRRKIGKAAWGVLLAVLCAALVWYNVLDPSGKKKVNAAEEVTSGYNEASEPKEDGANDTEKPLGDEAEGSDTFESDAPIGFEVGERLEDFSVECLDGSTFKLGENRGKVTIINLWATYCGPCVAELPYFGELLKSHKEDLSILAVHAHFTTVDVGEYVVQHGFDIPIAIDDEDERIFGIVNGSSTLPQTIVLNRKGEVIYNEVRSVTPELLEKLYEEAAK